MASDALGACTHASLCPTNSRYVKEHNVMVSHYDPDMTPAYSFDCYKYSDTQYLKITTVDISCPSGTTRTKKTHVSQLCGASYTYYDCLPECTGCYNCTDNASWTAGNTGYEKRTKKTCNYDTCKCVSRTIYQCAQGYYGTSSNGTSGCTRCPRDGDSLLGTYGTTIAAGSRRISSCYIPAGASFSDTTGSGVYPDQCDYENDDFVILSCVIGDENFCLSNDDCGVLQTCNTITNCCSSSLIEGGDLVMP